MFMCLIEMLSGGVKMHTVLTYLVTLLAIVISVFSTLFIKNELERMFREEKEVFTFHFCNVIITLMASFVTHAVMTTYVMGNEFNWRIQLILLILIILPIYILGHLAFEKYKAVYRKYAAAENRKVLVLNEKYMKKKKPFAKLKTYNAGAKEK